MDYILLTLYAVLFCVTSIFLLFSYRRLREEAANHQKAKNTLEDVIYSFNKDLRRQEEKIQEILRNYEENTSENIKRIEEINVMIENLKSMLKDLLSWREAFLNNYESLIRKIDELSVKYDEILKKINETEKINLQKSMIINEMSGIRPSSTFSVSKSEGLASLTETELKVLEILAAEGEKTVPEIKDRIKLTREHTARLMKSLYARGYLERRADRIPYVYRLNKNVEEILKGKELT